MHVEPFPEYDIALSLEMNPKIALEDTVDLADLDPTEFTPNAPPSLEGLNAEVKETRLYFGTICSAPRSAASSRGSRARSRC